MKPLVVLPTFLLIRQDLVGLLNLLKALLGSGILGIGIGVEPADQLPVGFPNIVVGSAPGQPEHLIEVFSSLQLSPPTLLN
jgi:hypothetical protein